VEQEDKEAKKDDNIWLTMGPCAEIRHGSGSLEDLVPGWIHCWENNGLLLQLDHMIL
jgi:hypothetical protein